VAPSAPVGAGRLLVLGSLSDRGNLRREIANAKSVRRAAVSVQANIAEGFRRRGKADKVRYLYEYGRGDTSHLTTSLREVSRLLSAYESAILALDS
jgi:four helix bundle protein